MRRRFKGIGIIDPVGIKAGMDYYDLNLARGLRSAGFICYIYSNFIGESTHKFFAENGVTKGKQIIKFFFGVIKALLNARKADLQYILIHSFSAEMKDLYVFVLAKFMGFKIINIAHDISGFANKDRKVIKKLIYTYLSDWIVVHNKFSKECLLKQIGRNDYTRIKVIPHGHFLDLPKKDITKHSAREKLGIAEDVKLVLFFGQIKKQKGLDILINALKYVRSDIHLIIAGKPWKDDFSMYMNLIKEFGLADRIIADIGYIDDDLRELYFKATNLVVIPYREIYQSGVLLMGMSYRIPVIASNLKPNMEIIEPFKSGLIFESENHRDLAATIDDFFERDFSNALIENSIKYLEESHSWSAIAKSYAEFLK